MNTRKALLGWLLLLVVGFGNGVARQGLYARYFSDDAAHAISTGTAVVLLGLAMAWLLRRWPIPDRATAWRTGAIWCLATFLFETGMGFAAGHSAAEIFADYRVWEGRLWPLVLVWLLGFPVGWRSLAGRR